MGIGLEICYFSKQKLNDGRLEEIIVNRSCGRRAIVNGGIKLKANANKVFTLLTVTRPGFEPRQAEPESAVLPLYYRAKSIKMPAKIRF